MIIVYFKVNQMKQPKELKVSHNQPLLYVYKRYPRSTELSINFMKTKKYTFLVSLIQKFVDALERNPSIANYFLFQTSISNFLRRIIRFS